MNAYIGGGASIEKPSTDCGGRRVPTAFSWVIPAGVGLIRTPAEENT
jgi:hypothetical protein